MSVTIDSLQLEVQTSSRSAVAGLEALETSLNKIKNAVKGGLGLTAAVNQLTRLGTAANSISSTAGANINLLAKSLEALKQAATGLKISSSVTNQFAKLTSATSVLSDSSAASIASFTSALASLKELSGLKISPSIANQLRNIVSATQGATDGFASFPNSIKQVVASTSNLPRVNNAASKSFAGMALNIGAAYAAVRVIGRSIAGLISQATKYIENINLFSVSMGRYAKEAERYAQQVSEVMGINPGDWMRNQGIFQTLAEGFGIVSDRAYIMSKNLTQLGYDISSFFNIPIEESMQKLQSGISGEIEPLNLAA